MNEVVGMKNRLTISEGGKWIVFPFRSQEFWKYIGCVLLEVTCGGKDTIYGVKYQNILVTRHILNYK